VSASAPEGPAENTAAARPAAPSVLPSTKWLSAVVDFVEQSARSEGREIARVLRAEAARLTPGVRAGRPTHSPTVRWVRQLAEWLRADPRTEAADVARQVDAWAQRLTTKEQGVEGS
jgi:hypothetical protein